MCTYSIKTSYINNINFWTYVSSPLAIKSQGQQVDHTLSIFMLSSKFLQTQNSLKVTILRERARVNYVYLQYNNIIQQ